MNESLWMYFFMTMGILGIVIINIFSNVLISNEQNYYLLKEVTEASMYDAVDLMAYRVGVGEDNDGVTRETDKDSMHCMEGVPGTIRIVKEKFVESFTRRFAELANLNEKYRIEIYDIQECPAKVSLKVIVRENYSWVKRIFTAQKTNNEETLIVNELSGILETIE